ncbi:M20/M25/M40 family metallo-hydrolase [bacterium]|nr:M20/M25/M40 family metallo-hydrolase [bacterium]
MSPAEQLLRELIAIPSVNPAFVPPGHPHAGEQRLATFIAESARKGGLEVEMQSVIDDRQNVIARLTPQGRVTRRIILAPHMDTVPCADDKQLTPEFKGGKLYGRGACDTKGSLAVFLQTMLDLAKADKRPKETEIVLAAMVDEENAQGGSRIFGGTGFQADLAIVGEPTRLRVVTAHKGDIWLRLQTRGKAAHGSRPDLGRNAVLEMAKVVQLLETTYANKLKEKKHPLLGHGTISVGSIWGGNQPNIVPDHCEITADRRTLPGETEKRVLQEIRELLNSQKLRADLLDFKGLDSPPLETKEDNEIIKDLMTEARQHRPAGVDFFCDAAILSQAGITSVVFGPGDIAQAHTSDEWILVRQLNTAGSILRRYFDRQP